MMAWRRTGGSAICLSDIVMEHAMRASRSLRRISAKLKIGEARRVTEIGEANGKMVVVADPD